MTARVVYAEILTTQSQNVSTGTAEKHVFFTQPTAYSVSDGIRSPACAWFETVRCGFPGTIVFKSTASDSRPKSYCTQ